jgi:hypothetical protein
MLTSLKRNLEGAPLLTLNKAGFRIRNFSRDRKGNYVIIKKSILQEDI